MKYTYEHLAFLILLFTPIHDVLSGSDPSAGHPLLIDLNKTPPSSPHSEGENLSMREKKSDSIIKPDEAKAEGRRNSEITDKSKDRIKLVYSETNTDGPSNKSIYNFAPGTTYKEKKKVWNRERYRRERKGLEIDLNQTPPPSPERDERSQIVSDAPTSFRFQEENRIVDKQQSLNLPSNKYKYTFPPGTTYKEKKKKYNQIQYARRMQDPIKKQLQAEKKRAIFANLSEEKKVENLRKRKEKYKTLSANEKQIILDKVAKNHEKRMATLTESEKEKLRLEKNAKQRKKYHEQKLLAGKSPLTIDLNKTPPVSPLRDTNTDVQETSVIQAGASPVATADTMTIQSGRANEESLTSEKNTEGKRKRKKRIANRTYHFPPGTSLNEKRRAYSRMNYIALPPERKKAYQETKRQKLMDSTTKEERLRKNRIWYQNMTPERKEKHRLKVAENAQTRLEKMTVEQREEARLKKNLRERLRQQEKRKKTQ